MIATIRPGALPTGRWQMPPSKSMAHRALICAAQAQGVSRIDGLDYSADIVATIDALRRLGAQITAFDSWARVCGGPTGFPVSPQPVDCGESGSTLRFLVPLFSLTGRPVTFTGAPRLFRRPLAAYEEMFRQQGLSFVTAPRGAILEGALKAGRYDLPGDVSSQFVSGLLFALPRLAEDSEIHILGEPESKSYIDLTLAVLADFGIEAHWRNEKVLEVPGGQLYRAANRTIEGDWSQAAVAVVLGAVKGNIEITGVSANSLQGDKVILQILQQCGATVQWQEGCLRLASNEGGLQSPGDIDLADCPDLGPILCVLALFCQGTTRLVNAGRLRLKESDRIASMEEELQKLGAHITSTESTVTIEGGHPLASPTEAILAHNDHRVVMALAVAAACAGIGLSIEGAEAVRKSWPGFFDGLEGVGVEVALREEN